MRLKASVSKYNDGQRSSQKEKGIIKKYRRKEIGLCHYVYLS
jgi:hypothetical protein